ncbi:MAG TPA: hypothetical protein VFS61_07445 [Anaerolineales bacterium]|nr:hypothetical protein [Anaerolineales bacterium]
MRPDNPIRNLDPRKLAHYEKENYVAYYQKEWLKLLRVSVGMVKEAFGLSWLQAVYGAYLIARAEIAFAPFPVNDIPLTEAYVKRFYQFIKKVHKEDFDVDRAVKLEVQWWGVHRRLFGNAENQELVEALKGLYEEVYGAESEKFQEAAYHRAKGMLYSDLWVNQGKPAGSPLLAQEEEALYQGYKALKAAINN